MKRTQQQGWTLDTVLFSFINLFRSFLCSMFTWICWFPDSLMNIIETSFWIRQRHCSIPLPCFPVLKQYLDAAARITAIQVCCLHEPNRATNHIRRTQIKGKKAKMKMMPTFPFDSIPFLSSHLSISMVPSMYSLVSFNQ